MRYVARKGALFLVTLWGAITLNFLLPRLMPGSPVDAALARLASSGVPITNAERQAVEIQLGSPHASLLSQYGDYLSGIVHLNFGSSYSFPSETVAQTIGKAAPWTLGLVGTATVISFVLGTLLGVAAGYAIGSPGGGTTSFWVAAQEARPESNPVDAGAAVAAAGTEERKPESAAPSLAAASPASSLTGSQDEAPIAGASAAV